MTDSLLDVYDENDNIVGSYPRSQVHSEGLLHREVHIFIFDINSRVILQRRGQNKDTFPGFLDVSVGGHVEKDQTFIQAALNEIYEETGLTLFAPELQLINTFKSTNIDAKMRVKNYSQRAVFATYYPGLCSDLKVEENGEGAGFEAFDLKDLISKKINCISPPLYDSSYMETLFLLESYAEKLSLNPLSKKLFKT